MLAVTLPSSPSGCHSCRLFCTSSVGSQGLQGAADASCEPQFCSRSLGAGRLGLTIFGRSRPQGALYPGTERPTFRSRLGNSGRHHDRYPCILSPSRKRNLWTNF